MRPLTAWLAAVCVVALLVLASAVVEVRAAGRQTPPPTQAEVDSFIRDVLADAVTSGRFPDFGRGRQRYNVRPDLPSLKMHATAAALPSDGLFSFTLMAPDEAQAQAVQSGRIVEFIFIDIT